MKPALPSLIQYQEPLTEEELHFLHRKERRERTQLYKVARVFLFLSFICPFAVACVRAAFGAENPFSYGTYFLGVGFLMSFSAMGIFIVYKNYLRQVQRDISTGTKTIERSRITRKQYMPHTNTYFFYIDSPNRLSIEVDVQDYQFMSIGDEVNIEYTSIAKMYLGYY